jgi:hypothetical protein
MTLEDGEQPERVLAARVSHEFFPLFGVRPRHGRVFTPEEDVPGQDKVVVLSHRLWQRRFGSDPGTVGRTIRVSGTPRDLARDHPRENQERGIRAWPFAEQVVGDYRGRLAVLLGAVSLVLLIACANVASLLLGRGASRSTELAVRAALGAGRARIVRQLLTESLLLGGLSAAAGLAVARIALDALVAGPSHLQGQ